MPPTTAAAWMTRFGLWSFSRRTTASRSVRSYAARSGTKISAGSLAPSPSTRKPPRKPLPPVTTTRLPVQKLTNHSRRVCLPGRRVQIRIGHQVGQLFESDLRRPSEPPPRLGRIALEVIDFGRAQVSRIDLDEDLTCLCVDSLLVEAAPPPDELEASPSKRAVAEFTHRVRLACGDDIVLRLFLLQHRPHGLDVVLRVAPVAARLEIAEIEPILQAVLDPADGPRDLARDEGLSATLALVVKEDSVDGEKAVGLAVIDDGPVGEDLGNGVGTARVKRRSLGLRGLSGLPIDFR